MKDYEKMWNKLMLAVANHCKEKDEYMYSNSVYVSVLCEMAEIQSNEAKMECDHN